MFWLTNKKMNYQNPSRTRENIQVLVFGVHHVQQSDSGQALSD